MGLSMKLSPRSKFLLLVSVFIVPVVAAYLAFFGWRPVAHSNYGTLLKVAPLQYAAGQQRDGDAFNLDALQGKWVMVHIGSGECDASCERQLYLMRQTRLTQGKGQSRIERLWVVTDAVKPAPAILQSQEGLHVWHPTDKRFEAQFPAEQNASQHIYLIDPLGNLMLRFPAQPDHKGMMKDLKLLLKASQVG